MWFGTNIGYGFFLGNYSKKFIKLNDKLKLEKQPFRLFALIPEIYNKIDLTRDAIRGLINVYLGVEAKFRNFEDLKALGDMLSDYVKTSNIPIYSGLNFFSGVDIERHFLLFEIVPEHEPEVAPEIISDGFLEFDDNLLIFCDELNA